jgi:hypothetical protein
MAKAFTTEQPARELDQPRVEPTEFALYGFLEHSSWQLVVTFQKGTSNPHRLQYDCLFGRL